MNSDYKPMRMLTRSRWPLYNQMVTRYQLGITRYIQSNVLFNNTACHTFNHSFIKVPRSCVYTRGLSYWIIISNQILLLVRWLWIFILIRNIRVCPKKPNAHWIHAASDNGSLKLAGNFHRCLYLKECDNITKTNL